MTTLYMIVLGDIVPLRISQYGANYPTKHNIQIKYSSLSLHTVAFILIINQLDAQNLFYSKFISCLYMFRAPCAHRQEVKIVLYSLWYHQSYRCGDARGCIIQF